MKAKIVSKAKGQAPSKLGVPSGKKSASLITGLEAIGWPKKTAKWKSGFTGEKVFSTYGTHKPVVYKVHEPSFDAALMDHVSKVAKAVAAPAQISREAALSHKLVEAVASSPDVNALCETYKLKREELGRLTGFSLRALAEWAAGKLPSQPAQRRLQEVRRLLDALAEIVKRESIPQWLRQPNPAFDRLTPLQVIELGEMDRLWAMVHDLGSGQPT